MATASLEFVQIKGFFTGLMLSKAILLGSHNILFALPAERMPAISDLAFCTFGFF
jgi:hypothetical protein